MAMSQSKEASRGSDTENVRGRMGPDQEKFAGPNGVSFEHRAHNASPSQKTAMPRSRGKGKEKSSVALACMWVVDHQIGIALNLLAVLFLAHVALPRVRHHTQKFFRISYYNEETGTFGLGWDDICFVFYWIIVFTGMRCAVMDYILTPVAARAGVEKKKVRVRFAEQAWVILYAGVVLSCGMYIMYNSPYWLNLRALWSNWPVREMSGISKWYYLVQFAFWLQQIIVVHIEERRKDHVQMFTHHVITCALIFTSYGYHQTKVGNVILVLMDVVDLFLSVAKILKYLKFRLLCDIAFGVFMVAWFITRHVLFMWVCYSIYAHIPLEINYGCYRGSATSLEGPFPVPDGFDHLTQPFRDPVGLVCWNSNISWAFLGMLLALQGLLILWFCMILRVAWKVISGEGADDTRSDDEDEEFDAADGQDDEEQQQDPLFEKVHGLAEEVHRPYIEREVSSVDDEVHFSPLVSSRPGTTSPVRRSSRKKGADHSAHSTSVNLSDHKELLGRIGCDKPT